MIDEDLINLRYQLAEAPPDRVAIGHFRCDPAELLAVVDEAMVARFSHRWAQHKAEPALSVLIRPTPKVGVMANGIMARRWTGCTNRLLPVAAFITAIGFQEDGCPPEANMLKDIHHEDLPMVTIDWPPAADG